MTQLNPCPFCGCEAIEIASPKTNSCFVECQCCFASGPVAAWQRRSTIQSDLLEACEDIQSWLNALPESKKDLDEMWLTFNLGKVIAKAKGENNG